MSNVIHLCDGNLGPLRVDIIAIIENGWESWPGFVIFYVKVSFTLDIDLFR